MSAVLSDEYLLAKRKVIDDRLRQNLLFYREYVLEFEDKLRSVICRELGIGLTDIDKVHHVIASRFSFEDSADYRDVYFDDNLVERFPSFISWWAKKYRKKNKKGELP